MEHLLSKISKISFSHLVLNSLIYLSGIICVSFFYTLYASTLESTPGLPVSVEFFFLFLVAFFFILSHVYTGMENIILDYIHHAFSRTVFLFCAELICVISFFVVLSAVFSFF